MAFACYAIAAVRKSISKISIFLLNWFLSHLLWAMLQFLFCGKLFGFLSQIVENPKISLAVTAESNT